jgi:hypothetical protein
MKTDKRTTGRRAARTPAMMGLWAAMAALGGCGDPTDMGESDELMGQQEALRRELPGGGGGIDIGDLEVLEPLEPFPVVGPAKKIPVAVVLCQFAGETPGLTRTNVQTLMGNGYQGMDHYLRRSTFDAVSIEGTAVTEWRTLGTRTSYQGQGGYLDGFRVSSDCMQQARSALNLSAFEHAMLVVDNAQISVTGSASGTPGSAGYHPRFFALGSADMTDSALLAGELLFELRQGLEPRHAMVGSHPYNSLWDGMNTGGCGGQCSLVRPIAAHMEQLGWLPTSRVFNPTTPGTYDLHIERAGLPSTAKPIVAKIPTGPFTYLTVETRFRPEMQDYDQDLVQEGVVIHDVNLKSPYSTNATLVDDFDLSNPNDEGSTFAPGESFFSPSGASVSVVDYSGTGADVRITVPGHRLTVQKQTEGSCGGTVRSVVAENGIACGTDCSENYLQSVASVSLRAYPSSGVVFKGWSGCTGANTQCVATMDRDRTVTAHFECEPPECYRPCLESCKAEGQLRISQCVQLCRAECN